MSRHITLDLRQQRVTAMLGDAVFAEADCAVEDCDDSLWATVRDASVGQDAIDVMLSPPNTYRLRLSRRPIDLAAALRDHAPLLPDRLLWSAPRDTDGGGCEIVIARRDRLAAIAALLADQALPPAHFIDCDRCPLGRDDTRKARRGRVTIVVIVAALLGIPAIIAIDGWRKRETNGTPAASVATTQADRSFAAIAAQPTVAGSLVQIVPNLPDTAILISVSREPVGAIALEIDTPDPDLLREQMRQGSGLLGLRERSQRQTADARYRVTYAAEQRRSGDPLANGTGPPGAAIGALRRRLSRDARAETVSLGTATARAPAGLAAMTVTAVGPQRAVLAFAERVETQAPPARFASWTIRADPVGVRLSGVVLASMGPSTPAAMTPAARMLPPLFAPAPPPRATADRPELVGIAGRLPDDAEAIVRLPGEPTRAIRKGDTLLGWTLIAIAADRAVFTRDGQEYVATLAPPP